MNNLQFLLDWLVLRVIREYLLMRCVLIYLNQAPLGFYLLEVDKYNL